MGDLSKKFMKISDIVSMEKVNKMFGISRELHIADKNRNSMELVSWNRDGIISEMIDDKNIASSEDSLDKIIDNFMENEMTCSVMENKLRSE